MSTDKETETKYVWIIEQGEYSDYGVKGIFSSEENAQLVCDKINSSESYYQATVSKQILDEYIHELRKGYNSWLVHMRKDGTTERLEIYRDLPRNFSDFWLWDKPNAPAFWNNTDKPKVLVATIMAKDSDHAVKITNEHRIQLIAKGEW